MDPYKQPDRNQPNQQEGLLRILSQYSFTPKDPNDPISLIADRRLETFEQDMNLVVRKFPPNLDELMRDRTIRLESFKANVEAIIAKFEEQGECLRINSKLYKILDCIPSGDHPNLKVANFRPKPTSIEGLNADPSKALVADQRDIDIQLDPTHSGQSKIGQEYSAGNIGRLFKEVGIAFGLGIVGIGSSGILGKWWANIIQTGSEWSRGAAEYLGFGAPVAMAAVGVYAVSKVAMKIGKTVFVSDLGPVATFNEANAFDDPKELQNWAFDVIRNYGAWLNLSPQVEEYCELISKLYPAMGRGLNGLTQRGQHNQIAGQFKDRVEKLAIVNDGGDDRHSGLLNSRYILSDYAEKGLWHLWPGNFLDTSKAAKRMRASELAQNLGGMMNDIYEFHRFVDNSPNLTRDGYTDKVMKLKNNLMSRVGIYLDQEKKVKAMPQVEKIIKYKLGGFSVASKLAGITGVIAGGGAILGVDFLRIGFSELIDKIPFL